MQCEFNIFYSYLFNSDPPPPPRITDCVQQGVPHYGGSGLSRRIPERMQHRLHRALRDDIQGEGQTIQN